MKINFVDGSVGKVSKGSDITFVKLGTPGSRRWHIEFSDGQRKTLRRSPVRSVVSVTPDRREKKSK